MQAGRHVQIQSQVQVPGFRIQKTENRTQVADGQLEIREIWLVVSHGTEQRRPCGRSLEASLAKELRSKEKPKRDFEDHVFF